MYFAENFARLGIRSLSVDDLRLLSVKDAEVVIIQQNAFSTTMLT